MDDNGLPIENHIKADTPLINSYSLGKNKFGFTEYLLKFRWNDCLDKLKPCRMYFYNCTLGYNYIFEMGTFDYEFIYKIDENGDFVGEAFGDKTIKISDSTVLLRLGNGPTNINEVNGLESFYCFFDIDEKFISLEKVSFEYELITYQASYDNKYFGLPPNPWGGIQEADGGYCAAPYLTYEEAVEKNSNFKGEKKKQEF